MGGGGKTGWGAALWVLALGGLGAAGLVGIVRWHRAAAHSVAALTVAERGRWAAVQLAGEASRAADEGRWEEFSRSLRGMKSVEGALAFAEVRRGETTLFLEDEAAWLEAGAREEGGETVDGEVRMGRAQLGGADGESVGVVTFEATSRGRGGEATVLELGLKREAVRREERAAMGVVESMYRLCVAGWVAVVALAAGGVGWMFRREERRERQRRREEHLAFSGMLANGIVHDFRNPMSSLRLDAQLLAQEAGRGEGARPEKIAERAGRIKGTLDRMERIFQEFLTLARPEDGAGRRERVDLGACAAACAEMMATRYEASGVRLEAKGEEGVAVEGASAAIQRALLNVLANALQHTAGKGERVEVRWGASKGRAWLEVEDEGEGIPKGAREKVFEMFWTTRPQGTGLGLFLARAAVEKCGGSLRAVEPRGGRGACLRMEFPELRRTLPSGREAGSPPEGGGKETLSGTLRTQAVASLPERSG